MIEMIKKEAKQKELDSYLDRLLNMAISKALTERKDINKEVLKGTIKKELLDLWNKEEYFDEKKFISDIKGNLEMTITDEYKDLRDNILNQIITKDEEGNEKLNAWWRETLEDYYRRSPEKKGINFRDQIRDAAELRAWLYLALKDEQERNRFRGDFERALSQKEPIYFKLWPPSIVNGLRYLILGEAKPKGFKEGEFFREVRSYIEDLQKGKDRITFWFEENLLPEELRNRPENELRNLGIERHNRIYEFYLTPGQISDFIVNLVGVYTETIKRETELTKLFKETIGLYRDVTKKAPKELKTEISQYGSLIVGLEEMYRNMLESGGSKEEFDKIKNSLNAIKANLEEIKKDIEAGKKSSELKSKISKFLKEKGSIILSSIGLWGLAIGWFLPLWLIAKMDQEIQKLIK